LAFRSIPAAWALDINFAHRYGVMPEKTCGALCSTAFSFMQL